MKYTLFVDLDGVLADFDRGVLELTGRLPSQLSPRAMWPILSRTPDFYNSLAWTIDGKELWEGVQTHKPLILTGLPLGKWAEPQKRAWCARVLGESVEVICCLSREKAARGHERSGPDSTPILIDDREKLREAWEAMGGIFILHRSAQESLEVLSKVLNNFLPEA